MLVLFDFYNSKNAFCVLTHSMISVVIPTQRDQDIDIDIDPFQPSGILPHDSYFRDQHSDSSLVAGGRQRSSTLDSYNSLRSQHTSMQRGASFRRVIGSSVLRIPDGNSGFFNSEACLSGGSTFLNQFVETNTENFFFFFYIYSSFDDSQCIHLIR